MTLRDRIVKTAAAIWNAEDIADAILADPEIAALRDVAACAKEVIAADDERALLIKGTTASAMAACRADEALDALRAALARLEEARK